MINANLRRPRAGWLGIGACLVVFAAACGSSGSAPRAARSTTTSATTTSTTVAPSTTTTTAYPTVTVPIRPDHFGVGYRTATFVDTSRNTPKSSAWPKALRSRTMVTEIWYPSSNPPSGNDVNNAPPARTGAPFPLVVFGHGFTHSADHYQSLLHRWAAAGYVIAGPDLPSSSSHTQGHPDSGDENMEPADMSFAATGMRKLGTTAGSWAQDLISQTQLVFSGHSQGGYDAFAAVFADCCRDPRITAAVLFAGVDDPSIYGHYSFNVPHPPVLVEAGSFDQTVALQQDVMPTFTKMTHVSGLLVLAGAHDATYESDATQYPTRLAADAAIDFTDQYVKGDATAAQRLTSDVRTAGQSLTLH